MSPLQTLFLAQGVTRVTYYKRFRMELALADAPPVPELPSGYYWVPWNDTLTEPHAETLCASFRSSVDTAVFPSLGSARGCQFLMAEIRRKKEFLPEATWLLACGSGYCGTVQGLRERGGLGAIQNLGITPAHRGRGLGTALLLQALQGFGQAGLGRALLEVTAENAGAVRLYHQLGFRRRKTVYKAVEVPSPLEAGEQHLGWNVGP